MILITVATEKEIKPLEQFIDAADKVDLLVTGLGPIAAAASLSSYLTLQGAKIDAVLNIGVAGAYPDSGIAILDVCMAKQEFLGDFGICMQDAIVDFDPGLIKCPTPMLFNNILVPKFTGILKDHNIAFKVTNFVTVNCCTGTTRRGEYLRDKFAAGCENMEGAAVAMVCEKFNIPKIELRCVSNLVEDRDTGKWQLAEAIREICRVTEILLLEHVSWGTSNN